MGLLLAAYFLANVAWTKPYKSKAINFLATFAELFIVSYFAMTITARLNIEVEDHYFSEAYYLTTYFYIKICIAGVVLGSAIWMRDAEVHDKKNRQETNMHNIEL